MHLKKSLGQHLLVDEGVIMKILESIPEFDEFDKVIEVGPGTGKLSRYLMERDSEKLLFIEKDDRFAKELPAALGFPEHQLVHKDFLQTDLSDMCHYPSMVLGNFPYNISSQILFHILDHKDRVKKVVGMFQKEVGQRIAASEGNKQYGVISIFLQAYYNVEYLFDIPPEAFDPPPKVMSAMVSLERNDRTEMNCDSVKFRTVVKTAFQQRRKKMRNSLRALVAHNPDLLGNSVFDKRPEQLSIEEFESLTNLIFPR